MAISSISGEIGIGMRSAYCASKAAVNLFFRSLAIEEADIRISIMMPDSFSGSNFRANSLTKPKGELPSRKTVSVSEVADVVMMASDRNARITLIPFSAFKIKFGYSTFEKIAPNMLDRFVRKKSMPA